LLSVIRLNGEVDAGTVIGTRKFDISPHDNIRTRYYKTDVTIEIT
jgi:hypothetical protein